MVSMLPAGYLNDLCASYDPWANELPAQGDGKHPPWKERWLLPAVDKRHLDHAQAVDTNGG